MENQSHAQTSCSSRTDRGRITSNPKNSLSVSNYVLPTSCKLRGIVETKWRHSTTKLTVTDSLVETGLYSTTTTRLVTIQLWIYCKQFDRVEITRPLLYVWGAKWRHSMSPILTTLRWKYGLCSTNTRLHWSSSTASNRSSADCHPPTPTPCKLRELIITKWRYSAPNLRRYQLFGGDRQPLGCYWVHLLQESEQVKR